MAIQLKDRINLGSGLNTSGTIVGLTNSNGISGTNYNIENVNQLTINDPGEGIVWLNGSSGNITLAVADDSSDNILELTGTGRKFKIGEAVLGEHAVHSGYYGLWNTEAIVTTTQQYLIISAGTDTYINGDNVYIRAGNNSSTNELKVTTSGTTIGGNTVLHAGNYTGYTDNKYLRSDADDSYSGNITATADDWYLWGLGARGASAGAYGLGNGNDDAKRQLTFHVPNHAAYSSTGIVPSFGWYSNGAVEVMKLESDSGNLWAKGNATIEGNLTIGKTGTTPLIDMMFNDHASGAGWDTRIQIGLTDDFAAGTGVFPAYLPSGAYGIQFQANSDAVFFGMEEYSSGNYRPIIQWGDDDTDSPFRIKHENGSELEITYNGDVTTTGDLTVGGGDIVLSGTGRIQGVDTVSASTDAANKTYVDNAVAGGNLSVLNIDGKKVLDLPSNSTERGPWNPIVSSIRGSGRRLYPDEEFRDGSNGVGVYNNAGGDGVVITREADSVTLEQSAPNSTGVVLKIVHNGNSTSPGHGGFIHSIPSQDNHTFVQIFQAKLDSGRSLVIAENAQGSNNTSYWLTNTAGTGKWEWYARVSHCGDSGTFSSGGHVYVSGGGSTFTWYLASCTVIDVTEAVQGELSLFGDLILEGDPTTTNQTRAIKFTGFDKETATDFSDNATIYHTTNAEGFAGSVLVIESQNDSNDGIAFKTNASSNLKHNSNTILTSGNYSSTLNSVYAASSHTHDDRYYTESESDDRFCRTDYAAVTNANDWNSSSGTWNSGENGSWGNYKIGDAYAYNDAGNGNYVQYNVPSGMKTAYIGQLRWTSGGYFDVYAVESDGDLVLRGRYTSYQNVENSDHGGGHDGQEIIKISGLDGLTAIRITNRSGRVHLQGVGWTKEKDVNTTGQWGPHWDTVLAKPSTFSPSSHNHSASEINSGTLSNDRLASTVFLNRGSINVTTTAGGNNSDPFDNAHTETQIAENGSRSISYTGASAHLFTSFTGGSASVLQLGAHYNGTDFYARVRTDGSTWRDWRKLWHNGNFNPASYLTTTGKAADSNLLDGIDSSQFIRSDADDTVGGRLDFNASESIRLYGIRGRFTNEYIHLYNKVGIGHPSGWGQGQTDTPDKGLSTYGAINVGYGVANTSIFHGAVVLKGQAQDYDGSDRGAYWDYDGNVALALEPAGDDGATAILFKSIGNAPSDFGYIVFDEDYPEAGVTAGERSVLLLSAQNDGAGSSDHVRVKGRFVVEADTSSSDPSKAFQVKSSNITSDLFHVNRGGGGYLSGTMNVTGDVVAYYSDMRLKTKLGDITGAIGKIKLLNGFYYEPNEKALELGYKKEKRIGLSAQEVQEVLPEAVSKAPISNDPEVNEEYLSVDYAKLIPLLVEGIKELKAEIEELKKQIK